MAFAHHILDRRKDMVICMPNEKKIYTFGQPRKFGTFEALAKVGIYVFLRKFSIGCVMRTLTAFSTLNFDHLPLPIVLHAMIPQCAIGLLGTCHRPTLMTSSSNGLPSLRYWYKLGAVIGKSLVRR